MSEPKPAPDQTQASELTPIYLLTTPEIDQLLANFDTSLEELLRLEGLQAEVKRGPNPVGPKSGSDKDFVTIILATAGLALSVTPILTRALTRLTQRQPQVDPLALKPVEDAAGNVVRDANGQPILYWAKDPTTPAQPAAAPGKDSLEVKIQALGIRMSFKSKEN